MPNLNRVFLMGRLTRDPSLNSSKSGTVCCRFSLAINRRVHAQDGSQREEVEYLDVMFVGRLADFCQHSLRKGSAVFVEGRLHVESWVDPKTKMTRKNPVVYGDSLQLLDGYRSGGIATPPGEVAPQVEEAFERVTPRGVPSSGAPGAPGRPMPSRRPLSSSPPPPAAPEPPPEESIF